MEQIKFYIGFFTKHFGDEWLVRNGNEYAFKNVTFYFPDYLTMEIYANNCQITVTSDSVKFSGEMCMIERLYSYIMKYEDKIVETLHDEMSEQGVFGAQLLHEDALADAHDVEFETQE